MKEEVRKKSSTRLDSNPQTLKCLFPRCVLYRCVTTAAHISIIWKLGEQRFEPGAAQARISWSKVSCAEIRRKGRQPIFFGLATGPDPNRWPWNGKHNSSKDHYSHSTIPTSAPRLLTADIFLNDISPSAFDANGSRHQDLSS